MAKYALVDLANSFFRCRHVASRQSDNWTKVGMALHLTLSSVNQVVRKFGIDHVVFCLEGRSWRKDVYYPYKRNRIVDESAQTVKDVEENKMFWETYEHLTTYLRDKTNTSVLRCPTGEADDLIARFIHLHPKDEHYIISTDGDFYQLITENVKQFNGVTDQLITIDGYYDARDRPVKDKKTNEHKKLGDPKYLLFEKCIRGDAGDNVFSAYPGVRTKGSKNKTGLIEAYSDKEKRGFQWNNMMLQRWVDHEGVEHKVLDDYNRNVMLCDLTAQPQQVKDTVDSCIREQVRVSRVPNVGVHLMKFCARFELTKISDQSDTFTRWMNLPYSGELHSLT